MTYSNCSPVSLHPRSTSSTAIKEMAAATTATSAPLFFMTSPPTTLASPIWSQYGKMLPPNRAGTNEVDRVGNRTESQQRCANVLCAFRNFISCARASAKSDATPPGDQRLPPIHRREGFLSRKPCAQNAKREPSTPLLGRCGKNALRRHAALLAVDTRYPHCRRHQMSLQSHGSHGHLYNRD